MGDIMSKIENYWQKYAKQKQLSLVVPDSWMFGDGTKEMGNKLSSLVIQGVKTGTCGAKCIYDLENEKIPEVGQYDIVLDGTNIPIAIIQYTKIELVPMNNVSKEFARSEGEGDLSYDYWYKGHKAFFSWELSQYDLNYADELLLVCQTFKVVNM